MIPTLKLCVGTEMQGQRHSYAMPMHAVLAGGSQGAPSGPPPKLNPGQQLPGSTPPKIPTVVAPDAVRPGGTASSAKGTASGQATAGVQTTADKGQPTPRGNSAPGQGTSVPAGLLSPGTELPWTDCPPSLQQRQNMDPNPIVWLGMLVRLMMLQHFRA